MTRPRLNKRLLCGIATAAIGLATLGAARPATAAGAFADCTPVGVEVSEGQILTQCTPTGTKAAVNFLAVTTQPTGCSVAVDFDTMKIWLTTLQIAVANQKPIRLYNTPCNGSTFINALDSNK